MGLSIIGYPLTTQKYVASLFNVHLDSSFASARLLSASSYYPKQPSRHNLMLFNGTSCAGKSSLIYAFRRYIPNLITLCMDATGSNIVFLYRRLLQNGP